MTHYPAAAGVMRIDSTLYYVLKDHLGSASVVTDATGNTIGEDRFYPFGETRLMTGSMFTDKLFTGQRETTGLGIYHYNARFYSPKLGRFLSSDTVVPNPSDPQDLNRYSYVSNSPLNYIDPSGHMRLRDGSTVDRFKPSVYQKYVPKPTKQDNGRGGAGSSGGGAGDAIDSSNRDDDTGPITDFFLNLPFSDDVYNSAAIASDSIAWSADLFAAGVVTYGGIYGTGLGLPGTVVGGPAVPTVTGLAGMVIAEFYVQPILTFANILASVSTLSTVIADTKAGNTRIEDGVFSSNVSNSFTLTAAGWVNKEAYLSLAIQSVALSNDFGWTSLPFQTNP